MHPYSNIDTIAPRKKLHFISSVSLTETDTDTQLAKAWTDSDRLSGIWKSDLTDKMKRSFFQVAVVSIMLFNVKKTYVAFILLQLF